MAGVSGSEMVFSRPLVEMVNQSNNNANYDFIYGEYRAYRDFIDELNRVQNGLLNDGSITLTTGQKASMDDLGGIMAIQIYMDTLESSRQTMSGLSRMGIKAENKLWQLQ